MDLSRQTIAVIGVGNIRCALIEGLLKFLKHHRSACTCIHCSRLFAIYLQVQITRRQSTVHPMWFWWLKPTNWLTVTHAIRNHIRQDSLIVSVLAGLTTYYEGNWKGILANQPVTHHDPIHLFWSTKKQPLSVQAILYPPNTWH